MRLDQFLLKNFLKNGTKAFDEGRTARGQRSKSEVKKVLKKLNLN
jgi:hypothetical protein